MMLPPTAKAFILRSPFCIPHFLWSFGAGGHLLFCVGGRRRARSDAPYRKGLNSAFSILHSSFPLVGDGAQGVTPYRKGLNSAFSILHSSFPLVPLLRRNWKTCAPRTRALKRH